MLGYSRSDSQAPTMAGQRRPRPHSYAPQACERCRGRKQTCRNCIESKAECVFATPTGDKHKRRRGESHASRDSHDLDNADGEDATASGRASPVQPSAYVPVRAGGYTGGREDPLVLSSSFNSDAGDAGPSGYSSQLHPTDPSASLPNRGEVVPGVPADFDWSGWLSTLSEQQRSSLPIPQPYHPGPMAPPAGPSYTRRVVPVAHPEYGTGDMASRTLRTNNGDGRSRELPVASGDNSTRTTQHPTSHSNVHPRFGTQPLSLDVHPTDTSPSARANDNSRHPVSSMSPSDDGSMEEAAKGLAMISLEAAAEPHYVGESSGSLWSTLITGGMGSRPHAHFEGVGLRRVASTQPPKATDPRQGLPADSLNAALHQAIQQPLAPEVATAVLETVFRHLHPRYPFMDWVSFESQWERRDEILMAVGRGVPLDRNLSTAAFFILMLLAVGAQLCKEHTLPGPGLLRAEDYYNLAAPYLNTIVTLHNLPNIQGLLLLAIYSLRDSKGPSVWYLSGVTLRLCIGMGLHRSAARSMRNLTKYEVEMRKRVFWSCYTVDRMISLLLGRPPGISDDDFDVDLPEVYEPDEVPKLESMRCSSMASAVHHIKLKQIESRIQRAVYGIRRQGDANDYWQLLNALDDWEKTIPAEAAAPDYWVWPSCSYDWFLLKGVEARLHLLRPLCAGDHSPGVPFISRLATHAARGSEIQKRMHQQGLPMSHTSVHSAFTCGLALLYANFLHPSVMPMRDLFRGIKAASNTLFAYAQHARSAEVLYDMFEDLSAACIEHVSKRQAVDNPAATVANHQASVDEWQKVSSEVTSNIDPSAAGDCADLLQSLGIPIAGDSQENVTAFAPFWNFNAFSPGNLLPDQVISGYDINGGNSWRG
ncbi:hypothetical protein IAU60_005468 [Kwoniella sp. DSM 27419]